MLEIMLENTIIYTINLLKIFLTSIFLLNITVKKNKTIILTALISILIICILSIHFVFHYYEFPMEIIPVILLMFFIKDKKKISILILIYILISIIDVIFSSITLFVFNKSIDSVLENFPITLFINCISLFLIIILIFVKHKTNMKKINYYIPKSFLILFIIEGIILALYTSAMQVYGLADVHNFQNNLLALCINISGIVSIIINTLLLYKENQNEQLKRKSLIQENALKAQTDYYTVLLQKENETKQFRHDIQNHIFCIYTLYRDGKHKELGEYLTQLDTQLQQLKPKYQTGHDLVNAITSDISSHHPDVTLNWNGTFPAEIKLSFADLCTILSNLLNNAFEAAEKTDTPTVDVSVRILSTNLIFTITNPTAKMPKMIQGEYISSKPEPNHGFGLKNVSECIEKNKGTLNISCEDHIFTAEVVFINIVPSDYQ